MRKLFFIGCPVVIAAFSIGACAIGDTVETTIDDAGVAPDRRVTPIRDTGVADTRVNDLPDSAADTGTNPRPDSGVALDSGSADSGVDARANDSGIAADASDTDASSDSGSRDASADAAPASGCDSLRINEVQVAGVSASDEFVELYNTSATLTVSTANCRLAYRSKAGVADINCITTVHSIAPGGYAVFAGTGFPGAKTGALACQMAGDGGQLGLFGSAALAPAVDTMAYATAANPITANPNFIRGAKGPVLTPAANSSVGRKPDGQDTQITFDDFKVSVTPTPGAANL